jgi:hypothetical protein
MESQPGKFNILYYSRHCNHSNKVLEYIAKHGLLDSLNCICVDRRTTNEYGQIIVQLENGTKEPLPPMIQRVPALLLVKEKYQIRYGTEIIDYYKPAVAKSADEATGGNEGEPLAFQADSFSSSFSAY